MITDQHEFSITGWALVPKDWRTLAAVKDFGIETFRRKTAAKEKASPLFELVKVKLVLMPTEELAKADV